MSEARRHRTQLEAAALGLRLAQAIGTGAGDAALADALGFPARFAALAGLDPAALAAARAADPGHPLDRIATLEPDGALLAELALLACLPEMHEGYAALLRLLHPEAEPQPTVALALYLLESEVPAPEALSVRGRIESLLVEGPVAALGLVRTDGEGPWQGRPLVPGPGLVAALAGRPPRSQWITFLPGFREVPGLEDWLERDEVRRVRAAIGARGPCLIAAVGESAAARTTRIRALLGGLDLAAVRATVADGQPAAAVIRDVHGMAFLNGAVPMIEIAAEMPSETHSLRIDLPVIVSVDEAQALPDLGLPILPLPIERLGAPERRRMWAKLLPQFGEAAGAFATRYPLEPDEARAVVSDLALRQATAAGPLDEADVAACVRLRTATRGRPGVRRIVPRARWSDLLLPPAVLGQLTDAVRRIEQQVRVLDDWAFEQGRRDRRGLRVLFHGPPGTGKTLAAEALAQALGLDLMIADIAGLVSKWIGETEKNLAAVFELAERAHAVLLFDEADALFGRRTDGSDANARYANLETAFLLQRLESFQGVAILATNLRATLDAAFTRRFDDIVAFGAPDTATRAALWRLHLPAQAPLGPDVDLETLAEWYPLSGAQIRNAAIGAAYSAAADRKADAICQTHLLAAVGREFDKGGLAFPGRPPARAGGGEVLPMARPS